MGSAMASGKNDRSTSPAFINLAELRLLRGSEQVAAVCFRVRKGEVEFLLVQTGGGRWTFPKGNAEPGLTQAQSAALEAFEEAGVHGRIEEASFAQYVRRKGSRAAGSGSVDVVTNAYLCEVSWLDEPQELDRDPTWFDVTKSRRRLRLHRSEEDGAEHCRIIDLALERIGKVAEKNGKLRDSREAFTKKKK